MEEPRLKAVADPASPEAGTATESSESRNGHAAPYQSFLEAVARLGELREYAGYWIDTKIDSLKTLGRGVLLYVVAGIFGLAAGVALAATAAVLLLLGVAHGLGELFHHVWIGEVLVGVLVFGGIASGLMVGLKWLPHIMRKQLVSKYDARQRKQRSEFGRDVAQQARVGRDRTEGHSN